ncbi:MAG: adenylate/guanylate cyclase domain-containing protein [Deltaproteobacteria bacterium]|nr:adenylate/guanylate cyclase domain-containing protein [Deltaproteobacteria bacterium]
MKRLFAIASVLTLLFLGAVFLFPKFFAGLEAKWVDQYFHLRGPKSPRHPIALAVIDEKSLNQMGRWPWPRSQMGRLVEKLNDLEAKAAGFDITFSEVSAEDPLFAQALQKAAGKTVLGFFFYPSPEEVAEAVLNPKEAQENEQSIHPSALSFSSKQMETSGRKVFGVQANVPLIAQAVGRAHQGFFNVFPDEDGVIRSAPLVLYYRGEAYPSLALQMAGLVTGFSPIPIYDEEGRLKGLSLGKQRIPLQENGELWINYSGAPRTFEHISAVDILQNKIEPNRLKNKIVLAGATAIGIYDMRVTPFSAAAPGVEIQATVLENILSGDFVRFDADSHLASLGLVLLIGLLLGLLLPRLRALPSALFFAASLLILWLAGYLLFLKGGWVLPVVKPTLNGFLVFGTVKIYRFFTEEKERRKIRKTFQHYLSPAVIKEALEHPERLKLGGERKVLTVLFSDIRDFTPKSEKLPPEKLVRLLNDYFTAMTEIVFKYEGTLDKFMGDAIMAIYGAPLPQNDHALRAGLTALEMIQKLNENKAAWCAKYGLDDFKIGIGIHTGEMAVGNMGSLKRFNYTVIGDAVNLASRLETLTKEYKVPIIVSETHYRLVQEKLSAKKLAEVRVKGKEEATMIYELVGRKP